MLRQDYSTLVEQFVGVTVEIQLFVWLERPPLQAFLGESISLHELRVDSQLGLATFVLCQLESVEVLLFSFFVLLYYVLFKPLVIPESSTSKSLMSS
jgi:hypothetical protein